ncbi:hypothetical protein E3N88_17258 [Mikania micrantha]|uniref:RWP-RK domain-containing protein n=1 Tax=Mikania micrantha TaxID=192012 RepID=A0A5N6NRB5_9ASTR|nr:hypothetical protein E3N88_17258 [Mikania micrantha]
MSLFSDHQVSVSCKIRAVLKLLTFREQHVIVQFWSPREVGKHQLLTTIDQPFGVGVASEALCFYRRDSEHNVFLVDKDNEEEDFSPPARVFRRGLPEWTPELDNYKKKDFPQLDCAIRCNLHGYLALPVFDSSTRLCVGVLELLTSVTYTSYAFEVQQVHKALKAEHLSSPEVFDYPIPKALYECKQTELDKIFRILKNVCDYHNLPLAQAWTVSPSSSFVSNNKVIEKTCSSFDTRCIGKVCLSSANLPFYVRDMGMWHFIEACRAQHLDKHSAFVGKALLARGSYYVENVSELSEDEYPLVHNARMSGLTRCFTVFLHSVERDAADNDEYVLEFFLQLDDKDIRHLLALVQTLKQIVEFASGFELGEISPVEVTEPPGDVSCLSLSVQPQTVQISSTTTVNTLTDSSDSDSLENDSKTDSAIVPSQQSSKQNHNDAGKKNNQLKQTRKRKIDSLAVEAVKQHLGKSLDQTAQIFGGKSFSRSTMKRFCRKHGISCWPVPNHRRKSNFVFDPKLWSQNYLQRSSSPSFGSAIGVIVYVVLKVKRWSCSTKKHGFSGKWWSCGKHSYLPFHDLQFMARNTTVKFIVEAYD